MCNRDSSLVKDIEYSKLRIIKTIKRHSHKRLMVLEILNKSS